MVYLKSNSKSLVKSSDIDFERSLMAFSRCYNSLVLAIKFKKNMYKRFTTRLNTNTEMRDSSWPCFGWDDCIMNNYYREVHKSNFGNTNSVIMALLKDSPDCLRCYHNMDLLFVSQQKLICYVQKWHLLDELLLRFVHDHRLTLNEQVWLLKVVRVLILVYLSEILWITVAAKCVLLVLKKGIPKLDNLVHSLVN